MKKTPTVHIVFPVSKNNWKDKMPPSGVQANCPSSLIKGLEVFLTKEGIDKSFLEKPPTPVYATRTTIKDGLNKYSVTEKTNQWEVIHEGLFNKMSTKYKIFKLNIDE